MPTPQSPGTNEHRCAACGRFFNNPAELAEHERQCEAAQRSGSQNEPEAKTKEGNDREWVSIP